MNEQMRGKIKKAPAKEVVDYLIRPGIANDLARSYQTILSVNKAHVIMLAEENIITRETAKQILKVTQEISKMQENPVFEISPDVEDLYFNLERYLIQQTGIEIGGQQHTARSRNDMIASIIRMDSRAYYLQICQMFNELREALLEFAKENTETVMSGYTHLQPSEPITMAHYGSAILNAFERDYDRISNAFASLNICPLGGCAMASTTFLINRETTAKLLGFDGYMANSIDCVAARDYVMEIVSALAIAANTLSRLAQDLYIWATPEYAYIEVDDSVAVCSSIMPQKKNPLTLEHVKAKAAHLEGIFVSVFSGLKSTPYTHCRDVSSEAVKYYWTAFKEIEADLKLMTVTIKTLKVNKERMAGRAKENFCAVTELANYLVRHDGISFRAAHEVVALVVNHMIEHNMRSDEITRDIVNNICNKLFNLETKLTDADIRHALDPVLNAQSRKARGGSNKEEVIFQLNAIEKALHEDRDMLTARTVKIAKAAELLEKKTDEMIQA